MKSDSNRLIKCALIAGFIGAVAGCIQLSIKINAPEPGTGTIGGRIAPPAVTKTTPILEVPTSVSGPLPVLVSQLGNGNNGQACFPNPPWDRYYLVPKYLIGPSNTPDANCYTNSPQSPLGTIKTCDPANGTNLETGIVIFEATHPYTDQVCAMNSDCPVSTNLTINQRTLANNKRYRAVILYKSSTLGSLTSITNWWSYP